jgi:hypothetical protein
LDKPALPIATSFLIEGAGLPTLPTGKTTTIFISDFAEEEEGASRQS